MPNDTEASASLRNFGICHAMIKPLTNKSSNATAKAAAYILNGVSPFALCS